MFRKIWQWLMRPSPTYIAKQALEMMVEADRVARLDERIKAKQDISHVINYYEAIIALERKDIKS